MIIFLSILLLGLIGFFLIHLFASNEPRTPLRVTELFLLYQLIFSVGLTSLLAFYGLTFMTDFVAAFSGWPTCPFAKLFGNVNLAFATLGILCIWIRGNFWLATILGTSIWLLGDAITHIIDMVVNRTIMLTATSERPSTRISWIPWLLITYAFYRYFLAHRADANTAR